MGVSYYLLCFVFLICVQTSKDWLGDNFRRRSALSLTLGWLCVIMPSRLSHSLFAFAPFKKKKALRFAEMSRWQLEECSLTDHSGFYRKRIWAGGRFWCWIWTGDVNESSPALCEMWTEVQDVCHVLRGLMWFVQTNSGGVGLAGLFCFFIFLN